MPIIGVKRARSEVDYQSQSPVKKSSPAPGLWTRLTSRLTGYISRLISYDHNMNPPDTTTAQPMTSDNRVKQNDVLIISPCTRPLYTPVLSELERNEKRDVITPTTVRHTQSLLFTPKLLSNNSKYRDTSSSTDGSSNRPLSTTISQTPSNDRYRKRQPFMPSRLTSKGQSSLTIKDQTMSLDRSRHQSIQSRSRNPSTLTNYSRLKDLTASNNSSPIFSFLQTPTSANNHVHVRIPPQHSPPHNTSPSSPVQELQQWFSEFKTSYHSNRRDLTAQIDAAKKYARLQLDQRNQMCDQRMEQLRKRFDSGLDISELLIENEKMSTEEQSEMRLEHDDTEQTLIQKAFGRGPPDEELSCAFRIRLKRRDFQTLYGLNWLNDEVVNFYMSMIAENCSDVHSYSSFFYPKLVGNAGYSGVRRWTKKVDIFSKRLLLVPVHLGMHWCLATINFTNKHISYYDSMLGHNPECLRALKQYLVEEAADKKQMEYDTSQWQCITHEDIPGQQNGSDCGVFMCMYARHLARNKPFHFSQNDMPKIREHMVLEMLEKKLI